MIHEMQIAPSALKSGEKNEPTSVRETAGSLLVLVLVVLPILLLLYYNYYDQSSYYNFSLFSLFAPACVHSGKGADRESKSRIL